MALDAGTRLGPYEILGPLGSGGMPATRPRRVAGRPSCSLTLPRPCWPPAPGPFLTGPSETPFGQPAADIKAVPGSRGLSQGRSEVVARHGIVATSDPLAAQAGLDILHDEPPDAACPTGSAARAGRCSPNE